MEKINLKPEFIKNFDPMTAILQKIDLTIPFTVNTKEIRQLKTNGESSFPEEIVSYIVESFTIDNKVYDLIDTNKPGLADPMVQKALNSYMIEMGANSDCRTVFVPHQAEFSASSAGMGLSDFMFLLNGSWKDWQFQGAVVPILAGHTYVLPNEVADDLEKELYNRSKSIEQILADIDPNYMKWVTEDKGKIG